MLNLSELDLLGIDYETYYDEDYSISKMTTTEYIRDPRFKTHGCAVKFNNNPTEWISHAKLPDYFAQFDWSRTALVAHNMAFDGFISSHHYGIVPCFYYDTLSMSRGEFSVNGKNKHSLDALSSRLGIGTKIHGVLDSVRGIRDLSPESEATLSTYAIQDLDLTIEALQILRDKWQYPEKELRVIDLTLRAFCNPKLVIDRKRVLCALKEEIRRKRRLLKTCGVPKSELMSNDKFAQLLRDAEVNVPMKISARTGKETYAFAKNDLDFQQLAIDNPHIADIIDARLAVKSTISETRAHRIYRHGIPTLPILMNYCGAHTMRWSGGDKMNPQNLPSGRKEGQSDALRRSLLPPPGYKVVVVDSAQIEARMTAWFCGQEDLLDQFRHKKDPYSRMAEKVFGYAPFSGVTKIERFVGKTIVLGLGYGMGWKKLKLTLKSGSQGPVVEFSDIESQNAVRIYRFTNNKIEAQWGILDRILTAMMLDETVELLDGLLVFESDRVHMPNGLCLHYPGLSAKTNGDVFYDFSYEGKKYRTGIWGGAFLENIIQCLSRIAISEQALTIGERYPIVLLAHDEVVYLAKEDEAEEAYEFGVNALSTSPAWCADVPLTGEGGWDDYYRKY